MYKYLFDLYRISATNVNSPDTKSRISQDILKNSNTHINRSKLSYNFENYEYIQRDHSKKVYVISNSHTNGMEAF